MNLRTRARGSFSPQRLSLAAIMLAPFLVWGLLVLYVQLALQSP